MKESEHSKSVSLVNQKGFSAILLLILVFTYIKTASLEGVTPWFIVTSFSSLSFVGLYFFFTFSKWPKKEDLRHLLKIITFTVIIVFTIGISLIYRININVTNSEVTLYHDGALQTEDAFKFFIDGRNPYIETYYDASLGERAMYAENISKQPFLNPALEHYIYLPVTFLFAGGVGYLENIIFGFQDIRFLVVLGLFFIAYLIKKLMPKGDMRATLLVLLFFNPVLYYSLLEGRNDILVLALLFVALFSLHRERYVFSGVLLGLALATKQFAWLFAPFIIAYMLYALKTKTISKKKLIAFSLAAVGVAVLFILPFFLWGPMEFIDDTILYATGASDSLNYPITGFGFSPILLLFGHNQFSSFPFWLLILLVSGPVLFFMFKKVYKEGKISNILLSSSLFMFSIFLFSRFFNDNYVLVVIMTLFMWYVFKSNEDAKKQLFLDKSE